MHSRWEQFPVRKAIVHWGGPWNCREFWHSFSWILSCRGMANKVSDNSNPPVLHRTCLQQVSYDCQDAGGANGVLFQVGKLRYLARICCGRQGEMPHCKKKHGAVLPPSPKRTEQDMPLLRDWRFSRFLTCRTSRRLVQKTQALIQDSV
jgi:hypothetical protein